MERKYIDIYKQIKRKKIVIYIRSLQGVYITCFILVPIVQISNIVVYGFNKDYLIVTGISLIFTRIPKYLINSLNEEYEKRQEYKKKRRLV